MRQNERKMSWKEAPQEEVSSSAHLYPVLLLARGNKAEKRGGLLREACQEAVSEHGSTSSSFPASSNAPALSTLRCSRAEIKRLGALERLLHTDHFSGILLLHG